MYLASLKNKSKLKLNNTAEFKVTLPAADVIIYKLHEMHMYDFQITKEVACNEFRRLASLYQKLVFTLPFYVVIH